MTVLYNEMTRQHLFDVRVMKDKCSVPWLVFVIVSQKDTKNNLGLFS